MTSLRDQLEKLQEHCTRQTKHIQEMVANRHKQEDEYDQLMERFRSLQEQCVRVGVLFLNLLHVPMDVCLQGREQSLLTLTS